MTEAEAKKRFPELSRMKYQDQAIFYLNGFWTRGGREEAENIKKFTDKMAELDKQQTGGKGAEGNELDQFWSAKFLEEQNATMTATARKEALKKIDQDSNGKMSLIEYLVWIYDKTPVETVLSPQGDNTKEIEAAQKKMQAVQTALEDVETKSEANRIALEESKQAIEASKQSEAQVRAAEAELEAAVAELASQEKAYKDKISGLESKANDDSLSTVKKSQAAAELASTKQEDPMPLRKAKITQEAALRKVQKQRQEAEAAVQRAQEKKQRLEESLAELEKARDDLSLKMDEAKKELEEVKAKGGVSYGNMWFMERALFDADARLAKAKQKYDHSKPFKFMEIRTIRRVSFPHCDITQNT